MELASVTSFTPWASLLGGVLIGLSAVIVMALFGRIAGISGISQIVISGGTDYQGDQAWRWAFLVGLVAAPLLYIFVTGSAPQQTVPTSLIGMALAGLCVGVGTAWGSGCTSGHGVCGLARLSVRSLAAVVTFMGTGALTVFVLRHLM